MIKKNSAEHAFEATRVFFYCFWHQILEPLFLKFEEETKETWIDNYQEIFFINSTLSNYDLEFSDCITRLFGVPPEEQLEMELTEDQAFDLAVEYCRVWHETQGGHFQFTLDMLDDMKKNPDKHKDAWDLWKRIRIDLTEKEPTHMYPGFDPTRREVTPQ